MRDSQGPFKLSARSNFRFHDVGLSYLGKVSESDYTIILNSLEISLY